MSRRKYDIDWKVEAKQYADGSTCNEIAARIGCSVPTVLLNIKPYVEMRAPGRRPKAHAVTPSDSKASTPEGSLSAKEVLARWMTGEPPESIAKSFGCDVSVIKKLLVSASKDAMKVRTSVDDKGCDLISDGKSDMTIGELRRAQTVIEKALSEARAKLNELEDGTSVSVAMSAKPSTMRGYLNLMYDIQSQTEHMRELVGKAM
jgi:DNA-binding CsgD family transcriptional regulator